MLSDTPEVEQPSLFDYVLTEETSRKRTVVRSTQRSGRTASSYPYAHEASEEEKRSEPCDHSSRSLASVTTEPHHHALMTASALVAATKISGTTGTR